MKVKNDKYYTDVEIANHCWDVVLYLFGCHNFSEIIEPSCGDGAFYNHPQIKPHFGYDIEPEFKDEYVLKADFLKTDIEYLQGRLIIGNPPYGDRMSLARKFFKKAVSIGDYIAFILPISQLDNTNSLYEFDLVYSEDLGVQYYSGKALHCCFNVYSRPSSEELNKKIKKSATDIKIWRQDCRDYDNKAFDIRMCYWGNGSAGKILAEGERYSAEYKIQVLNKELRGEILEVLKNFKWEEYLKCIAMRKIQQFHIINVLREKIQRFK